MQNKEVAKSAKLDNSDSQSTINFTVSYLVPISGSRSYSFNLPSNTTIAALKREYSERTGVPMSQIRLICGKNIINDDKLTLAEAGIQENTDVTLAIRMRGGELANEPELVSDNPTISMR